MPEQDDDATETVPDPWSGSEGRVGAPAPPSWGTPPHAENQPAAIEPAKDKPAEDQPENPQPGPPLPWDHQPYGVQAWGTRGDAYAADPVPSGGGNRLYRLRKGYARYQRYGTYGRTYVPYDRRRRTPSSPQATGIVLLFLGLFTAGILYPLFAVIALAAAVRARRRTTHSFWVPPARTWLVYAVVFAVLGATSITLFAVFGDSSSSSGPPMVAKTVPLGQSATVLDNVAGDGRQFVPVTVTVESVTHDGLPAGSPDNTRVQYRVCAGPRAISAFLVTYQFSLQPAAGLPVEPDPDVQDPDLDTTLAPGHCLSGQELYRVPAGTTLAAAHYGILQTVTWPLGPTPGG